MSAPAHPPLSGRQAVAAGVVLTLVAASALLVLILRPGTSETDPGFDDEVLAAVALGTGQVVVGGRFGDRRIARVDPDGALDESFGVGWGLGFSAPVRALAAAVDDSVLAGGDFTSVGASLAGHIARITPQGEIDTAFLARTGTGFDGPVVALAIDEGGRIWALGDFKSYNGTPVEGLLRLLATGEPDPSFSPPPQDITSGLAIALGGGGVRIGLGAAPWIYQLAVPGP